MKRVLLQFIDAAADFLTGLLILTAGVVFILFGIPILAAVFGH